MVYEYYIFYNIKQTELCKKCFNNTYIDNIQKLFLILLLLFILKFIINKLTGDDLNKKQLILIYIINLSIVLINLLILYNINILIIQKDIIENEYNIECNCLFSITTLKILNNISLFICLFYTINMIIYIVALINNDIDTVKYYNELINKKN